MVLAICAPAQDFPLGVRGRLPLSMCKLVTNGQEKSF